jgi:hypothetical protein
MLQEKSLLSIYYTSVRSLLQFNLPVNYDTFVRLLPKTIKSIRFFYAHSSIYFAV